MNNFKAIKGSIGGARIIRNGGRVIDYKGHKIALAPQKSGKYTIYVGTSEKGRSTIDLIAYSEGWASDSQALNIATKEAKAIVNDLAKVAAK